MSPVSNRNSQKKKHSNEPPEPQENSSDQLVSGFSSTSDWLSGWPKIFYTNHRAPYNRTNAQYEITS